MLGGAAWPGRDNLPPPVIFHGRPGRHRPRINSEHLPMAPAGSGPYYMGPNGLLIPAAAYGDGLHRTRSAANNRPAQVTIINDNVAYDDHHSPSPRRPRSAHRERRYHRDHRDYEYDEYYESSPPHSRVRSHSHVRRRTPSPYPEQHHHDHHHEPQHQPQPDFETDRRLRKLEELEKAEEEQRIRQDAEDRLLLEEAREKKEKEERKNQALLEATKEIQAKEARKKELELEAAREAQEAAHRKKEEEEFKKKAIEDWKIKQIEEEEKKTKAKQKEDEEYKERMRKALQNNGYPEEEIERILKQGEKGKGKNHGHHHPSPPVYPAGAICIARPTFLKVNKKHIDPETLDTYELEWEYDDVCFPPPSSYILLKLSPSVPLRISHDASLH